jgi:hypothetical protein
MENAAILCLYADYKKLSALLREIPWSSPSSGDFQGCGSPGAAGKGRPEQNMVKKIKPGRQDKSPDFPKLADAISNVHAALRGSVAATVNSALTVRNLIIGRYIVEYEQDGERAAGDGGAVWKRKQ